MLKPRPVAKEAWHEEQNNMIGYNEEEGKLEKLEKKKHKSCFIGSSNQKKEESNGRSNKQRITNKQRQIDESRAPSGSSRAEKRVRNGNQLRRSSSYHLSLRSNTCRHTSTPTSYRK
jgi:hypothetical protein